MESEKANLIRVLNSVEWLNTAYLADGSEQCCCPSCRVRLFGEHPPDCPWLRARKFAESLKEEEK